MPTLPEAAAALGAFGGVLGVAQKTVSPDHTALAWEDLPPPVTSLLGSSLFCSENDLSDYRHVLCRRDPPQQRYSRDHLLGQRHTEEIREGAAPALSVGSQLPFEAESSALHLILLGLGGKLNMCLSFPILVSQ